MRTIAVADVGGTHARFALAEIDGKRVAALSDPVTLKTADHASFQLAWQEFGRRAGIELPDELAIAFAGPVGGDLLKLTNNPWVIRPALIEAPARCFSDQNEVLEAFKAGELDGDCAVVVRFQGPRANGMPELHKLTPTLGVLQDRGHKVALITDGRMSGASGKVPAAIHVSPEALPDGPLARVRDGDMIRLDARSGTLEAVGVDLSSRPPANSPPPPAGTGRELFALMRMHVNEAEAGASAMLAAMEAEQA